MSVFILSSRPVSAPPAVVTRFPLESTWTGWDGSVWDLRSGAQGAILLADGVEGLHEPKYERFTSSSRAVPGHRVRGTRALPRDVLWPLLVFEDTSEEFLATNRAFWNTIHPELTGVWRVTAGSSWRELRLTGTFSGTHAFPFDPYLKGWAQYVVELEAAQPFWVGETVSQLFELGALFDFIPPGGAPAFTISRGSTFEHAAISNPGDVAAYPVWTAVGPLSSIELGVGTKVIEIPFNLTDGQVLRIDTDPRNQTATRNGADVTEALGVQVFAAIDPGRSKPLTVQATGSGSITIELTPLYRRAF